MKKHVESLAAAAAKAANDNEGTTSMKLSQAAVNLTHAMMNLQELHLLDRSDVD